jgi:hypothetical protein
METLEREAEAVYIATPVNCFEPASKEKSVRFIKTEVGDN